MEKIVLQKPGSLVLETGPEPELSAGHALVRIHRVGVCGTDLHAFLGKQPYFKYPRVLGHELGVEIIAISDDGKNLRPGMLCAVEPYINCCSCIACRHGRTNCCKDLQVLGVHTDGGMCEQLKVPVDKLHFSEQLSLDQLAMVEPLSIGAHAVKRAQLKPDETALIIGLGPIGLAVVQFAKLRGAKVIALDVRLDRLEFADKSLGVESTILGGTSSEVKMKTINRGEGPNVVFDATGNPSSMNKSIELVAPGGRLIFVGLHQEEVCFKDDEFHRRELTLLASRNSTASDFLHVISLMEKGLIQINPWITYKVPYAEVIDKFSSWVSRRKGFLKAMIKW